MAINKLDFQRLMNQARVKLLGASDAALKAELFDVLDEFFTHSSSWLEQIEVPVIADTVDYSLVPAEDGRILRLAGVVDANNVPQPVNMPVQGEIHLGFTPNSSQTMYATVVKTVALPNTDDHVPVAPDWVVPQYGRTILDGLLGKMMMQQNKSYSNDKLGAYHLQRFLNGTSLARVAVLRRNTFGTQAWSFPQNFRTRNQRGSVSAASTRF